MVSVNYNMKIYTEKTKATRASKGSEPAMKIVVAGQKILLLRKHDLRLCQMPQRDQEKYSNGKRSLFQQERITKGRIEKMSQERNGEKNDLECDLVLCRNMDSEKGRHHKIGSL